MMIKLPETVTGKVYSILCTYTNEVSLCSSNFEGTKGYVCLGEGVSVTIDVPQEDPTIKIIEGLENNAEDIQAETTAAVRVIMDQIQQLKCLEHKPEQDDV